MSDVKVIKFGAGSPTDTMLDRLQARLNATTGVEAFRRGMAIADRITEATAEGKRIFIEDKNGTKQELIIS